MATLFIYTGEKMPDIPGIEAVRPRFPYAAVACAVILARAGGCVFSNDPFFLYKINNFVQKHFAGDPDGLAPNRVAMMAWNEEAGEFRSLKDPKTKIFTLDHIDNLFDDLGQEFGEALDRAFSSGRDRHSRKTSDQWGNWHRVKDGAA